MSNYYLGIDVSKGYADFMMLDEQSVLTRQGIKERVSSKEELIGQVEAWYSNRNKKVKKVDWQFTTKDARVKLKRLYPTNIT
jgi:hypothetical protein